MNNNIKRGGWVMVTLIGCLMLVAVTAAAKDGVTVTISPLVQAQIQKASPDERKKMESAISVGNKFIPHHFDGSAYDVGDSQNEQELKYWLRYIRPLVNRDMAKWYSNLDISQAPVASIKIDGLPNGLSASTVAVCPRIELISIVPADESYDINWETYYPVSFVKDSFVLKYRARTIGTLNLLGQPPTEFFLDKNENFDAVLISMDKSNKVSQVVSQYAVTAWNMKRYIDILTRYISGVWSHNTTAGDKSILKQLILKMKDDEAKVCENTAVFTKQTTNKE